MRIQSGAVGKAYYKYLCIFNWVRREKLLAQIYKYPHAFNWVRQKNCVNLYSHHVREEHDGSCSLSVAMQQYNDCAHSIQCEGKAQHLSMQPLCESDVGRLLKFLKLNTLINKIYKYPHTFNRVRWGNFVDLCRYPSHLRRT